FLPASRPLPPLHSFPTRRSSDLSLRLMFATALAGGALAVVFIVASGRILETLRNTLGVVAFHAQHGLQSHPVVNLDNPGAVRMRSEEHTSELQSRGHLVCRLLLE